MFGFLSRFTSNVRTENISPSSAIVSTVGHVGQDPTDRIVNALENQLSMLENNRRDFRSFGIAVIGVLNSQASSIETFRTTVANVTAELSRLQDVLTQLGVEQSQLREDVAADLTDVRTDVNADLQTLRAEFDEKLNRQALEIKSLRDALMNQPVIKEAVAKNNTVKDNQEVTKKAPKIVASSAEAVKAATEIAPSVSSVVVESTDDGAGSTNKKRASLGQFCGKQQQKRVCRNTVAAAGGGDNSSLKDDDASSGKKEELSSTPKELLSYLPESNYWGLLPEGSRRSSRGHSGASVKKEKLPSPPKELQSSFPATKYWLPVEGPRR